MSTPDRATGLIATSGIELLTYSVPNGHKASILLEELKEAYGKDYVFQRIDIRGSVQKSLGLRNILLMAVAQSL